MDSDDLLFRNTRYISSARAEQILAEPDEDTKYEGESPYQLTDTEQTLSQSIDRAYTEYFDEFVPNTTPVEARKHKYSVSIHPAIWTPEVWEVSKKFEKVQFDKD